MSESLRSFNFLDTVVGDTRLPLHRMTGGGSPVNGANGSFANIAGPGALLETDEPALYINAGSSASPTWTPVPIPGTNPGGGGVLATADLVAQVTLTSAQVLALESTPINVVPAPASGSFIVVDEVTYEGSGAYTQADGAGLVYHGTSTAADGSYKNAANPFINGSTYSYGLNGINAHAATNESVGALLGLGVDIAAITTNPTVGTTAVRVTARYHIVTP